MRSIISLALVLLLFICGPMVQSITTPMTISAPQKQVTLSSDESWLDGWDYRKQHTINQTAGAGTDYQVPINVYYNNSFSFGSVTNITSDHAHQGITTDGVDIWTTKAGAASTATITKYSYSTLSFESNHTTGADGTLGSRLGDLVVVGDYLYVVAHSESAPYQTTVMKYNKADLSFVTEYNVTQYSPEPLGGIAYHDSYFWLVRGASQRSPPVRCVEKYDATFNETGILGNYTMSYSVTGSYTGYEGGSWYGDYFFCNTHAGSDQETVDVYHWNGTGFDELQRLDHLTWPSTDTGTAVAGQGLEIENFTGTYYVWWASRDDAGGGFKDFARTELLFGDDVGNTVYLDQRCETDFDDIRFTEDDGSTQLSYWIEDYNVSGHALFWVKITDNLSLGDSIIYIYYGNNAVSTTSNGDATFLFYEDWTSESINTSKWETYSSDGTFSYDDTDAKHGSIQEATGNAGTDKVNIESNTTSGYQWYTPIALRYRANQEKALAGSDITQVGFDAHGESPTAGVQHKSNNAGATHSFHVKDDDGNVDDVTSIYWDAYYIFEIRRNGTDAIFLVDDIIRATIDNQPDAYNQQVQVYDRDSGVSTYTDWFAVRKFVNTEPSQTSWGYEEEAEEPPAPEWNEINEITIYLVVPINPATLWALDGWFMLLGAGMVIFSTTYAAYKIRSKSGSKDDIFFFLLLFIFGWALLIGTVL